VQFSKHEEQHHSKSSILAQNSASQAPKLERQFKLRWLLALSIIPLFGIVTAFGIAPQTITSNIPTSISTEDITLPPSNVATNDENDFWQTEVVRRDDTLASLLKRLHIQDKSAINFLRNSQEANALVSRLKPGQPIQAQTTEAGDLIKLEYQANDDTLIVINQESGAYHVDTQSIHATTRVVIKSAKIKSSLFGATDDANIPDNIAIQLADIFSTDIDFNSDLRRGDNFKVIYEVNELNGEEISTGKVLAAEFINNGKTYRAIMYQSPEGKVNYYTPEGKNLHKSFLRSPLEFTRISSGFSLGRFHPILNTIRAHKGVDLAAPIGTRIKASGDATVEFVGVKGGYGNVIVLNHDHGVSTVYGHLSRFESGLRKGMKVEQGDVIGYVGMTGLATGPHLHYEFLINGEQRDPMTVALPNVTPIAPQYLADFMQHKNTYMAQLGLLNTSVASLE
jgi:murein DD-endopeptidase MepM/ murein hydrolase activator NlpD